MTDIVPIPALRPSSEFPTNADRNAGVFNSKAFNWANTSRDMAADMSAIADAARTNAIATNEIAVDAKNVTAANKTAAQNAQAAAELAAANAAGSAAFYGRWSELTGPLNMPANVTHSGKDWRLVRNLPNVAAAEPGVSDAWEDSSPVRKPSEWVQFTSNGTFACSYDGVVRGYALGSGASGTTTYGGGGGSMGYGDIPVAKGDVLSISFSGGSVTISKNGVQMLRGVPASARIGGVAVPNNASVSNGGSYSGGDGGNAAKSGGGAGGSPLGKGGNGAAVSGGGGGGFAGNATSQGGGGCGYGSSTGVGGGSGGPGSNAYIGGAARSPGARYADPLISSASGKGAAYSQNSGVNGEDGGGGSAGSSSGGSGGLGAGGGGGLFGGCGGFGGGGAGSSGDNSAFFAGNGGYGGGGGGAAGTANPGSGGAAIALLFY